MEVQTAELELAAELANYYADPLGFVLFAYPWGKRGSLENHAGPDKWQAKFLEELGDQVTHRAFDGKNPVLPIRMTRSSGHGIGKSTLAAWLVDWIMTTRPHSQGTVTANTFSQLQTKTWASIQRWTRLLPWVLWFTVGNERMYHNDYRETWFCSAQSCREENSEAYSGQHAIESTSFYIFDEASAIPNKIFEVAEGGLTDGEPMEFLFGNPTRNSGKFFSVNFGKERNFWNQGSIDARECKFPNKELIKEWVDFHGEDSDFVRVRVRGMAPRAGDMQFIDQERVYEAQKRPAKCLPDDWLIAGVDVARGGEDNNVIRYRRGLDARTIPAERIPGEQTRDSMLLVSKLSLILADQRPERKVRMMFVDSAFGGPVVNRLHQLGFKNLMEVNFGGKSPDPHQANMRAFMWQTMKDWMLMGSIDQCPHLETDLTGPGYHHDRHDRLVIESKEDMAKRDLASPDDGDALALTFAQPVAPPKPKPKGPPTPVSPWS